ncbi:MAG: hypothetical protein UV53_C0007G0005 [Candidatus Azambacteria bacterium GW2011_GWE1_42_9]|nr:MAG: hypothetical protein UV45_C0005G0010 [Candidatus Azambacteria bacterium GW2011_GWB1_42_72]KKS79419.1 MAG: hypothetical protein UV53_C0007G0005 [Candidatus Azambacteria bacterium GW2011_GWE1_42_9]KKT03336.1 MAG: hypothetical protein UV81_C0002G0089 [Candidatus Azambacteria bacterium GW2011_GWD1_43_18]KKT12262.1 MAG: hypothetical protein UV93_C0005G0017 [Candidatus Azambacteria bacterium GW2011_GWC2_43_27]
MYKAKVFCKNCDFKGEINIPEGVKIEEYDCSKCKNKELERVNEPARLVPNSQNNK